MKKVRLDRLVSGEKPWQELWRFGLDLLDSGRQTKDGAFYKVALEFQRKMIALSEIEVEVKDDS